MRVWSNKCYSQVLRWGALVFSVFYGFSHQHAISSRDKQAAYQHEYDRKAKLISDAKAKFAEKSRPSGGSGGKWLATEHCDIGHSASQQLLCDVWETALTRGRISNNEP